jgi:hypothetical protein
MKTIEEMEKEEAQLIAALWKIGQESREKLFNLIKLNVLGYIVLVATVLMLGSDIIIAVTCITAVIALSLNLMTLLALCLFQKMTLLRLKILFKELREIHQLAIHEGKLEIEKNGVTKS